MGRRSGLAFHKVVPPPIEERSQFERISAEFHEVLIGEPRMRWQHVGK
jgi:hypothetical protein